MVAGWSVVVTPSDHGSPSTAITRERGYIRLRYGTHDGYECLAASGEVSFIFPFLHGFTLWGGWGHGGPGDESYLQKGMSNRVCFFSSGICVHTSAQLLIV